MYLVTDHLQIIIHGRLPSLKKSIDLFVMLQQKLCQFVFLLWRYFNVMWVICMWRWMVSDVDSTAVSIFVVIIYTNTVNSTNKTTNIETAALFNQMVGLDWRGLSFSEFHNLNYKRNKYKSTRNHFVPFKPSVRWIFVWKQVL